MKRLPLKIKLTLLHTILMIGVAWGVLSLIVSLGRNEMIASVRMYLEDKVYEAEKNIRYDHEKLKFSSDLMDMEHEIYLSVYSSNGTLLYGKIPYDFDNSTKFENGVLRRVRGIKGEFYLLDYIYQISGYGAIAVRGVASITDAKAEFNVIFYFALIGLPLLILLLGAISYFMTVYTLRPVSKITKTVREIQKDGKLSRRVALGEGNDEIYHMAKTFDEMLEQLECSFQRERQFTSDVSHELRTPVAAMSLQCEALLEKDELDEETRQEIQMLLRKTRHISQLLSQLLLLSRADQGRARVEKEVLNFSEIAHMAVDSLEEEAKKKKIQIELSTPATLEIYGDETLLIRFWMNLLTNSLSYGKEGGYVQIRLWKEKTWVKGEIRDDGIGISKEAIPHIWERFYQEDPSRSQSESSGLGLSMVQWIVKEHQGRITVESTKGMETIFRFVFPLYEM